MSPTGTHSQFRRVVVVGSGSAGQRHASTLRRLLPEVDLVLVRRSTDAPLPARLAQLGVSVTSSLDQAAEMAPDLAVIAGPATSHAPDAVALLDSGATALVEKPLAATLRDGAIIAETAARTVRGVVVGYHLRFGDVVPLVARTVRDGRVGTPTRFRFEVGQHLDQWRPGTDPRRSVSARQELGGGVLLELSHELDGVRFVLDDVTEVVASLSTDGAPTDGNVETVADLTVIAGDGIQGEVHLDMTSQTPFRRWSIDGEQGSLRADLLTGRVELTTADGHLDVLSRGVAGERDVAEERLVTHLLDVARGAVPECTVDDGLAALAVVEAARRSAASGRAAQVERAVGRS